MIHPTLEAQLEASGLSEARPPIRPEQWRQFLELIGQQYTDLQLMAPARRYADDVVRRLIEDIAVGIMLMGPNTEILLANQAALDMFGVPEEALLGRRISDASWTCLREDGSPFPASELPVPRAAATLMPVRDVVVGVHRPHRDDWIWMMIDAVPYVENGRISQIIATLTDITALKEKERALQHNEATTRALLNAVPDMMIRCSGDGRYLEIRPFTHIKLLHPIEWYRDRHVSEILPQDISAQFVTCIRQALTSGQVEVIEYPLDRHGQPSHYEARMAASGPDEVLVMVRDITERKQTEQTLRESEARYQQLYASAQRQAQELALLGQVRSALAREVDLDGVIRAVVESVAATFGYTQVSLYLLQGDVLALQHQVGYEQVIPVIPLDQGSSGQVIRTGQPELLEDVRADPAVPGAPEEITSTICVPLFDKGKAVGTFNIESRRGIPLTEADLNLMTALADQISVAIERASLYTSLRESIERYQLVVDNVHEVIYQTDQEDNFTFLNPTWTQFTGFTLEESVGRHTREFTHPDDISLAMEERRHLLQRDREYSRFRLRLLTKDGSSRLVEVLAQGMFDAEGHPVGTTGTLTDLSDRLQAEQQALELKLKERTVEALKGFLSGVTHDLRTPLSVMNTSLYLLRRKLGETAIDLHYLENLEVQTAHLARLVDDMVDMSRLDEASVHYEFIRVDLNGLIRDVLYGMRPMAEEKQVSLTYQPGADVRPIMADQVMMGRVVRHLVHNAIQYTPAKGAVTIRTSMDHDHIMLEVSDTGIGIAREDLPYIFDRFFRGDRSRPSGTGGTGLGLSIVRRVVEAHQGSVHVISRPDQGSTFTVRLPAPPLAPRSPAT